MIVRDGSWRAKPRKQQEVFRKTGEISLIPGVEEHGMQRKRRCKRGRPYPLS